MRDITRNTPVRFPIDVNTEEVGSVVSHMLVEGLLEKLNLSASTKPQETRVHALSVLARVSKDPRFDGFRQTDLYKVYEDVMNDFSGPISEYVAQWSLDMHFGATEENQQELEKKLEELAWTYTVLYGLSGWTEGQILNADFVT